MNASYRLNTCKSRGNGIMCLHILDVDRRTGEYRVSNLPFTWGYPVERRPNTRCNSLMASDMNKRFIGKGWGCVWLACWWGNGSPRQRSVGVLRGRSPTLELRHGPNSYGRQQWGILIRKVQALSGFIGFKGSVGGLLSVLWNLGAQHLTCSANCQTWVHATYAEFMV